VRRGEAGAAAGLLVAVAAVLALLVAAAIDAGTVLAARREASAAADAAALAAAPVTFRPFGAASTAAAEAARFAAANGARLVRCRCPHDPSWTVRIVEVVVARRVGLVLFGERTITALSRARFDPAALRPDGAPS
jgi:hypothetical protein